jgi:hypothetical protein
MFASGSETAAERIRAARERSGDCLRCGDAAISWDNLCAESERARDRRVDLLASR